MAGDRLGKLIVLEGVDGVGKTTLAECIASSSGLQNMRHVSRRHVPAGPKFVNDAMFRLKEILWEIGDGKNFEAEFWIALQAAWFNGLSTVQILPLLQAGIDVLVDGWIYKFFAKLELQGFSRLELESRFKGTLTPDIVVLIERDIRSVLSTKPALRPTEMGLHAGYSDVGEASFLDYQQRVSKVLWCYAKAPNWHRWEMSDEHDAGQAAKEIANLIDVHLARRV